MNSIVAFCIFVAAVCFAFGTYWLQRFQKVRRSGFASEEEAQFVAECRNNISKQYSAAFCSVHRVPMDDEDRVSVTYQNTGYNTTLMTVCVDKHWLKCYFNWLSCSTRMEFWAGGDDVYYAKDKFGPEGVVNTERLINIFEPKVRQLIRPDKYPMKTLLMFADKTREIMLSECTAEEALAEELNYFKDKCGDSEDLAHLVGLITAITEEKRSREGLENYAATEEDTELVDEGVPFNEENEQKEVE